MHRIGCGMNSAARWMIRRTLVSLTPMTSMLVERAPSQWVELMISGPAMPENPATS
jgi:hypothetical protein